MEIYFVALWYLIVTALGWLVFPLAYRLLPALRDRGYSLSRTLGLLLWGYLFWILASLGILRNETNSLLLPIGLIVGMSALTLKRLPVGELRIWLRSQRSTVLIVEALFLLAFAGWAAVRAANPEAVGTEKPMELAFINAILGSPTFPPHDPWLAGYAISYYYFGYVLVGILAKLAGTPGAVAFNLAISLVFALCAIGMYGLVLNLLNGRKDRRAAFAVVAFPAAESRASETVVQPAPPPVPVDTANLERPQHTAGAMLGPLMVLLVSNLEGFFHLLHHNGLFWLRDASGSLTSRFWTWLDIKELNQPPLLPAANWAPDRFWWWWRASRVIQDYDLAGNAKEIINEFPFFSFLLADVHPHVLAMPFALLVMALALNLILGGARGLSGWPRLGLTRRQAARAGLALVAMGVATVIAGAFRLAGALRALDTLEALPDARAGGSGAGLLLFVCGAALTLTAIWLLTGPGIHPLRTALSEPAASSSQVTRINAALHIQPAYLLLLAIALGGMAFLNTWDFPIYVALVSGAYALAGRADDERTLKLFVKDFVSVGLVLGVGGVLLYFPFYLGFSSQAGGVIPNLVYPTRGAHFWVMFAPLLAPILVYLYHLARRLGSPGDLRRGLLLSSGLVLFLWIAALLLSALILQIPEARVAYLGTIAAQSGGQVFRAAITRRLFNPGGWLTLIILLTPAMGLLTSPQPPPGARRSRLPRADVFAVILALLGGLLALTPEFFFLRDLFGWRMNTIFKFYFQIWLIWSAVAAYASIRLLHALRRPGRTAFAALLCVLITAGLVYPALSLPSKTNNFDPTVWTLDSSAYLVDSAPDEIGAVRWLQTAPFGTIAEAVAADGGSYTEYGRFATLSGKPAVLGWVGHENQWRGEGSRLAVGTRQADLETLYCSRSWNQTRALLDRYHIRYVVVGSRERQTYAPGGDLCPNGLVENKFSSNLEVAFQSGNVTIYTYAGSPPD